MMHKASFILALTLLLSACQQQSLDEFLERWSDQEIAYIQAEDLAPLIADGSVVVMDVREWEEFEVSHLPATDWAGYKEFDLDAVIRHFPDKSTPIVLYCSLGVRSDRIGQQLKEAGFTNIRNLYGGIIEWKNRGFAIQNLSAQSTDSVHTYSKRFSKYLYKGIAVYD